uniref:Uncharacterized protein n=1 Tax=Hyaloperonospora arabidopsidis (strain Emoy2) TaxID=559515 RepID=M4C0K0_HYAAE
MSSRLTTSAAVALRRRQDPKLMAKFNLASLNGGKSPFIVSSNQLLKVDKKPVTSSISEPRAVDKLSLEYLLGPRKAPTGNTLAK